MSSEKFSLKWNDFEKNISGALKELKDEDDLYDVTLACGDEEVSAHKVILSACSPFLKNVLRRHKHQHPLLYIHGFSFSDLQSLLSFMYLGEVSIAQDQLNSFLAIAEELQVKGLTQGGDGDTSQPNLLPRQRSSHISKQNQSQSLPIEEEVDDDDIQEVLPVKTEAGAMDDGGELLSYDDENTSAEMLGYNDQQYGVMESSKDEIKSPEDLYQYVVKFGSGFQCLICQKTFTRRNDSWNHCENTHFPGSFEYACEHCDERFRSNVHYKKHKSNKHRVF